MTIRSCLSHSRELYSQKGQKLKKMFCSMWSKKVLRTCLWNIKTAVCMRGKWGKGKTWGARYRQPFFQFSLNNYFSMKKTTKITQQFMRASSFILCLCVCPNDCLFICFTYYYFYCVFFFIGKGKKPAKFKQFKNVW